jgi:tartrate-resistant acid phosphatase type 5
MPRPAVSASNRISRRGALKTLFCASAALALNLRPQAASAAGFAADDLHVLAIGDFGSQSKEQSAVARAMQKYVADQRLKTEGLLLLGDNFYGKMEGGLKSARWTTGFEEMYPSSSFPGPCWAILGNHDYHDNEGGQNTQLAYGRETSGTRWTMPSKWYRVDLPNENPAITMLMLDSDLPTVSGAENKKTGKKQASLSEGEEKQQQAWLEAELAKPRGAFTMVVGHHPIYSNGQHGDTKSLIKAWDPLLEKHAVHAYLCGHDHDLQHLEFEGRKTSFVVSGGGGARVRELPNARKAPYGKNVYGFTHLQISRQRMIFRHFDANGTQLHAFAKLPDGTMKLDA